MVFLPEGARLLGSVEAPQAVTVLALTALSPDSARRLYRRELPQKGWRGEGAPVRGPTATGGVSFYCRPDGWRLSLDVEPRTGAPADLRLFLFRGGGVSCGGERTPLGPYPDSIVPKLYPPTGTDYTGQDCTQPGWENRSAPPLSNAPPPDSLLRHYGRLLEEAGWTRVAPDPPTATGAWERTLADGRRLVGTMMIAVEPDRPDCTFTDFVISPRRDR